MYAHLDDKALPELREIADDLGVEYPGNVSKAKLIKRIIDNEEGEDAPIKIEGVTLPKTMSKAEVKKEMNRLVRVRISSNDPQYKGRNGVTRQIFNAVASVGKFIPFNTIWHCQIPVLTDLREQRYRQTVFKTDRVTGDKYPVTTYHPSFVIEELPALTAAELKKLAADQSARGSIPNEDGN